MKKIFAILLALLTLLSCCAYADEVSPAQPTTVTDLITQVVIWLIGGLFGLLGFALKKWVYPWVTQTLLPWLKDKHLISLAEAAVNYAEAQIGAGNGEEKWKIATEFLQSLGWNITTEEVIAALKSEWLKLDLAQITAGVKEPQTNNTRILSN